ncbi:MAG: alanine racemase [Thermoanaerobaculia bacterium]|nr:alanine racemase [Thermoanaerobaculia bacterium]
MLYKTLNELPTPALVLDLEVLERNVENMARRADRLGVELRPHFKTPKSLQAAELLREAGACGLTVSTLAEARAVILGGGGCDPWDDVTWAFPVILGRLDEVAAVANLREGVALRLVVDSADAVTALKTQLAPKVDRCHVWLKVDCGYGRCGVDPRTESALDLARRLHDADRLVFDGILSHSGHAYSVQGSEALASVAEEERSVMVGFAQRLRDAGVEVRGISVGSTPAMSAVRSLEGVTEARPGNYVFHDYSQVLIGSCDVRDCALTVVSQVVSHQPGSAHCILDAGALTLSKDAGPVWSDPPSYGRIYRDYESAELEDGFSIVSLSQEHGRVDGPLSVGTRVRIQPNHSCLVVPNFDAYHVVRGDQVVDCWPIVR